MLSGLVLVVLGRAARHAWTERSLALRIWRGLRPRHFVGSVLLLGLVGSVAVGLATLVPFTGIGLGGVVGLDGNVIFAPVEQLTDSPTRPRSEAGPPAAALVAIACFLVLLLALFPSLAHAEERIFRAGLERTTLAGQLWAALRFGAAHLLMLVPLWAAFAVGVAGFVYGRIYRRAYDRARTVPTAVPLIQATEGTSAHEPFAREEALLHATRWHVAFNSLVVVLLFASLTLA